MHNQVRLYGELFDGVVDMDRIHVTISRQTFACGGCQTVVEEYAGGFWDEHGLTQQWQPRIVDSQGVKFCSEMCAHKHGERDAVLHRNGLDGLDG